MRSVFNGDSSEKAREGESWKKLSWENEGKETPLCRAVDLFDSSILHIFMWMNDSSFQIVIFHRDLEVVCVCAFRFTRNRFRFVRVREHFFQQKEKPTIENSFFPISKSCWIHTGTHSSAHSANAREIEMHSFIDAAHPLHLFFLLSSLFCLKQLQLQAVYFVKSLINVIVSVMQCLGSFWDHYTLTVWHFQIHYELNFC